MIVGVPKEIKTEEYRVGLTPFCVHELVGHGHQVIVEHDAGVGIGFGDARQFLKFPGKPITKIPNGTA